MSPTACFLILIGLGVLTIFVGRRIPGERDWPTTLGGVMVMLGLGGIVGIGALITLAIAGIALLYGVVILVVAFTERSWKRWPLMLAGVMIPVGAVGFCGQGLSAFGGLNWLPPSFEWPAGSVEGVITTQNGLRVVPTTAAGRVQVYDAEWNFLRGWHIGPGAAGAYVLKPLEGDRFQVITARGNHRSTFNTDGESISQDTYPGEDYGKFTHFGEPAVVPTPWWLLPFTSPLIAWLVGVAGGALLGLMSLIAKRGKEDGEHANGSGGVAHSLPVE